LVLGKKFARFAFMAERRNLRREEIVQWAKMDRKAGGPTHESGNYQIQTKADPNRLETQNHLETAMEKTSGETKQWI